MDSTPETELVVHTCENLSNKHVYKYITTLGQANTARELLSLERCPTGLDTHAFKNHLPNIKQEFIKRQKSSHKNAQTREAFLAFENSPYVYPQPTCAPVPIQNDDRELVKIGDAETYAKVAFEIGAELNSTKRSLDQAEQKNKRKRRIEGNRQRRERRKQKSQQRPRPKE